jgi:hypothetical protein
MQVMVKKVGQTGEIKEMESGLEPMQAIVGGWIERVALPYKIDLWINEEGMIENLPLNLITTLEGTAVHQIYGDVFFASHDGEGNTVGLDDFQVKWLYSMFWELGFSPDPQQEHQLHMVHGLKVR